MSVAKLKDLRGKVDAAIAEKHTLSNVFGKRSRHQMLASTPVSILNHNTPQRGIPPDSINA
jgi:hypothetical protein